MSPERPEAGWLTKAISWLLDIVTAWVGRTLDAALKERAEQVRDLVIEAPKLWVKGRVAAINERFSQIFPDAATRHAQWAAEASDRLATVLSGSTEKRFAPAEGTINELSFRTLYARVRPPTPEWLATALVNSVTERGWQRIFRVTAPGRKWVEDFHDLDDIPDRITAPGGETYDVAPDMVTVVFQAAAA